MAWLVIRNHFHGKYAKNWVLEFSDPCTDNWEDHWFLDGKIATVENSKKGMNFRAGPVNGKG